MSAPTQYIANYGFLGGGKETDFGIPVAVTDYPPFESETFKTDPGFQAVPTIRGTRAENNLSYGGEIKSVGGFVLPFGPVNGPLYLAAALGTDVVTGSADPWTHTMTPNEAGLPSLTFEKALATLTSQIFQGCVTNKADLEIVTNAPARLTLDYLNQIDATPSASSTPSYLADTPFSLAHYSVSIFGSANTNVYAVKYSIDNMVKAVNTFSGQRYSTLNYSGGRVITGEVQMILQSMTTQYAAAMAGTYGALVTSMIQSSSRQCVITTPKIQWGAPDQPLKRGELITQTIPFTVFFIPGQTYDIQVVIKNARSTAY